MASSSKLARKGAAQAVSAIASIEIPLGQWNNIINTLSVNAQGETLEFKLSSLETLSYICEELPEKSLPQDQINSMLVAIISNVSPENLNEDVRQIALKALAACLRFCEKNFQVQKEKDLIMTNILANCSSPNVDIRIKSLQCVLEVVRCYYDNIAEYLVQIGVVTSSNIQAEDNEEAGFIALEVWCSMCDEECDRIKQNNPQKQSRNYVKMAYESLMLLVLNSIKKKKSSDEDWTISLSSACLLALIAQIVKDQIVDTVCTFISQNIGSDDWRNRDAALLAFGSILKGPAKATINMIISQAIPTLVQLFKDSKDQVKETVAWTFGKIADHNYEPIVTPEHFQLVVQTFLQSLPEKRKISLQICFAINKLVESIIVKEDQPTSPFSGVFKELINGLWTNGFRPDGFEENINLAASSFGTLSTIVQHSANDCRELLIPILKLVKEEFKATMLPNYKIPGHEQDYQVYLSSFLQPILIKLTGRISPEDTKLILDMILESFQIRKSVYDEGILAISALASAVGRNFNDHMNKFGPFLAHALKEESDVSLCRVAVGCVEDLARALEEQMSQYLSQLVPLLMEILKNTEADRTVKVLVIPALGSLAMFTNKFFNIYTKDVLDMLGSASQLTCKPVSSVFIYLSIYLFRMIQICLTI